MALSIADADISKNSLRASEYIGDSFASVSLAAIISSLYCELLFVTYSAKPCA